MDMETEEEIERTLPATTRKEYRPLPPELARAAGEEDDDQEDDELMLTDFYAYQASRFRDFWNSLYFGYFGSFEDTTKIPPMRFTDKKPEPPCYAGLFTTLQIFSVELAGIEEGLQWPLHVFGKIALRDTVDHNRNIIFNCTRDNCQILTQKAPHFKLTGPTRAVVLLDPVTFEVDLKVKGTTEYEDKDLSFLAIPFMTSIPLRSSLLTRDYTSRLSTLIFTLGVMVYSLEATIAVRVVSGSWPDGFRAQFAVETTSIGHEKVVLLDSGDDKVPVAGDGMIMLSRRVASVEIRGQLKVSVQAWQSDNHVAEKLVVFVPKKDGRSFGKLDVGFCQMDVTVAWSLISS
ncbi:hypothetical protein ACP70R_010633 [Stipagrostis hirtigluma subsp. patula]